MNDLRNLTKIFGKDVTYDNIKSRKKSSLHPFSKRHIFGKTTEPQNHRVGSNWPPPRPRRLKFKKIFREKKKIYCEWKICEIFLI